MSSPPISPIPKGSDHAPSVTVLVVPRERFSHARQSLESIYDNTDYPFDLIYVDGNSPPRVASYLRKASREKGFRLLRFDRFLSPNAARNVGLAEVRTDYVVCLDNDDEPEPGWLGHLVRCAEETGAWAVAPIYFEGKRGDGIVHMACGTARITEQDGVRTFKSNHTHAHRHIDEFESELTRTETELFEFHCVLLRMDAVRPLLPLDEGLLSNHEHEDLSLLIREAGGSIYMEPAARVTYAFGPLDSYDVRYAKLRWSDAWTRRSTRRFAEKWHLKEGWGADSIAWCNEHREDLLRAARTPSKALRSLAGRVARTILGTRLYTKLRQSL